MHMLSNSLWHGDGSTLLDAVHSGQLTAVRHAVEVESFAVNTPTANGITALMLAAQEGQSPSQIKISYAKDRILH